MGRRPDLPSKDAGEALENLRLGTRLQYESDWTKVFAGASVTLNHGLEEVPWTVDVIYSDRDDGGLARDATTLASPPTVTKTSEAISLTNTAATAYYFQVRAM